MIISSIEFRWKRTTNDNREWNEKHREFEKKKIIVKIFNFLMNFAFKQIVFFNFFEKWF